ncbi:hypothetical protein ACFOZ7_03825 [Natribaculum luteum]|uniref:Type II toxin-antitoxin system PemK/MazF family toxin n=1 Tax=Natribaculum luteum TaxID=1586232 RepID=A0ABD5NWI6_9EURY|nr:hypothetical protein [Natribaculum luteum]
MKRDAEGEVIEFERGDVVWGVDPFKQDSDMHSESSHDDGGVAPRPWLIISTDAVPFHPEQYLCLTLTTRTWHDESIPLSAESWVEGGAPEGSSIMPWSISAIQHRFLDTTGDLVARLDSIPDDEVPENGYQGHLTDEVTTEATEQVVTYLEATLIT